MLEPTQHVEQERRNLRVFSILFFVLAAIDAADIIIILAGGELNAAQIAEQAQVSESLARASAAVVIGIAILSILILVYLGWMGLRQYSGKTTATSHITIAKICVAFLVIGLIVSVLSIINSPAKDWIDLCTALAGVCIGMSYIRAAISVKP